MKILVIGQGGREHAIVHALSLSSSVSQIHVIPGSDGISREALCHNIDWRDFEKIAEFCSKNDISFVFIGPEEPLVAGLSDFLRDHGILVVGPSQESSQLEGSKIFAKQFMLEASVPTAFHEVVNSTEDVIRLSGRFSPPYVLKADGLAAGKGVFICENLNELKQSAIKIFDEKILGAAGRQALLEQFSDGWELSYLVLTNGKDFKSLPLAQDHKRLLDQDRGPNTGGMGAIAPIKIDPQLQQLIEDKVIAPSIRLLNEKNFLYRGILYFGLMITKNGPSVLEFNCRFGDPETQVILPLLDTDVGLLFKKLAQGELSDFKVKQLYSSCVVLASPRYPESSTKDIQIQGDILFESPSSYFIHSGTKKTNGQWLTNGGRVLGAIGIGSNLEESLKTAYSQADKVSWQGLQLRKDIGKNFLNS
jgi:phosphoribosylamine--glycine ligase